MRPLSRRSRQLPLAGEPTPQSAEPTAPLAGEPKAMACGAVLFASPAKGRWGRRKAHGSVGSRFFQQLRFATPPVRNPSDSQANHLPLTGEAMTVPLDRGAMTRSYFLHVSGAKRTSMGKISRRPRNMSKHRTALLIILSPETPMVKVFESMP